MKAKLEQIAQRSDGKSFLCYKINVPVAKFIWHYHPEYELTYILKGSGKRLVGDSYENFTACDLVLLGPLLPHTWITEHSKNKHCEAIVIQFSAGFVEPLFQYTEMEAVKKMLFKCNAGLHFKSLKKLSVTEIMQQMTESKTADKLIMFIKLLHQLTGFKSVTLASALFRPLKGNENQQRINKVFNYVEKDFKTKLSLQTAASLVHLSVSGFCKFFKKISGKTFSDYVNDIRIAYACGLLIETDETIAAIAFESGFDSLTYFNRVFSRKKKMNPGLYRKNSSK